METVAVSLEHRHWSGTGSIGIFHFWLPVQLTSPNWRQTTHGALLTSVLRSMTHPTKISPCIIYGKLQTNLFLIWTQPNKLYSCCEEWANWPDHVWHNTLLPLISPWNDSWAKANGSFTTIRLRYLWLQSHPAIGGLFSWGREMFIQICFEWKVSKQK